MLQPVASWLCTLHCLSGAKNVLLICPLFFLGVFSKGRTYLSLQFKALSERRRRTQTRSDKETIGSLLTEFHAWWVTRQPETCAVQGGPVIKKKLIVIIIKTFFLYVLIFPGETRGAPWTSQQLITKLTFADKHPFTPRRHKRRGESTQQSLDSNPWPSGCESHRSATQYCPLRTAGTMLFLIYWMFSLTKL